jgi:hypothetical protein
VFADGVIQPTNLVGALKIARGDAAGELTAASLAQ